MIRYKNLEGGSGVTAYEPDTESIAVEFGHDAVYLYTYSSAGKAIINRMKKLAAKGRGLSTYISQKVKDKYERKLK
jgi:hypothetical protein